MLNSLFNQSEKTSDRIILSGRKKSSLSKFINAYGKVELLIFTFLFVVIMVLAFMHNVID